MLQSCAKTLRARPAPSGEHGADVLLPALVQLLLREHDLLILPRVVVIVFFLFGDARVPALARAGPRGVARSATARSHRDMRADIQYNIVKAL